MPDETTESAPEKPESPEKPTQKAPSVPSVDKPPSSEPGLSAEKLAKELAPHLAEALRPEWQRDDQSVKDRRIQGLTDDVTRLEQYIKAQGGDVRKAVREMQVDDLLSSGRSSSVPGRTDGGGEGLKAAMEAVSTQVLTGAGIAFDDEEYTSLVKQYGNRVTNADNWRAVVQSFADRRTSKASKSDSVTGAAAAGKTGGTSTATKADEDALNKEYEEIMGWKRGNPHNDANLKRLNEIVKELQAFD